MKILVTGGSGMVGKYLQEYITFVEDTNEWIFISSKDYDLTSSIDVERCFQKYQPNHVIHLAANVGGLFKNMTQSVEMFRSNILMNQYIVDSCHKYNIQKAIFCLSTCVFPSNPSSYPITENMLFESPPHFSNASYAYSKRMLKLQCDNYNTQYNRQYICLSPVNLYGKWDNFNLTDAHVIPALIHKMYLSYTTNTPTTVAGTGTPLRQFLYAGDFAKIIYKTLFEYTSNQMMICSSFDELSISSIVDKINFYLSNHFTNTSIDITYDTTKSDGIFKKTASNSYMMSIFPDFTFMNFDTGLADTIQWFISNYPNIRS